MIVIAAVFLALMLSGANLRFSDPNMTLPMLLAAGIITSYVLLEAPAARPTILTIYVMAFMFATIALRLPGLLAIALFYAACYAAVIGVAFLRGSDPAAIKHDLIGLALFAIVLAWFAVFGHDVSTLRLKLAERSTQLRQALERVERIAIRDELTNLYNRRFLTETLQREVARTSRSGRPLSVCLLDISHFKQINDIFGHAAGDAVLRRFAELAASALRGADVLGRYGGEEFLVVMPEAGQQAAFACAERIRTRVEHDTFPGLPASHHVTVTAGVATALPDEAAEKLVERADAALYEGKRAGRNRVTLAS